MEPMEWLTGFEPAYWHVKGACLLNQLLLFNVQKPKSLLIDVKMKRKRLNQYRLPFQLAVPS